MKIIKERNRENMCLNKSWAKWSELLFPDLQDGNNLNGRGSNKSRGGVCLTLKCKVTTVAFVQCTVNA